MNKSGFTLMELVVAVAVASGLAAVAVPSYQNYVAKTQAAEAEKLINAERVNLVSSMQKGYCLAPGAQSTQKGRFGVLTTSGTFVASKGLSCDSGCDVTYTFNADANKHIAGKKIVVDMRLNGDISKNASTTVDQRYLSDNLNRLGTVNAGDNCTALSSTKPTATAGIGASGTETGAAVPPPPPPPPPPTPTNPTPPTTPPTPTNPTPPPTGDTGTPTPPTVDDCPKYKSQMICSNHGAYSCYMHNGSGWSGRSFTFDLSSSVPERYPQSAHKLLRYILSYGQCPGGDQIGYVGAGFLCTEVNRNNLQLNDKCSAETGKKWNIFQGIAGENTTSMFTYFYPLDLNRPTDLAYFKGNTSLDVFKEIYYRTVGQWGVAYGVAGLKGGGVLVNGNPSDISNTGRVQLTSRVVIAFVQKYGRCPANSELDAMKLPIPRSAISCKFESKYFTKY